MPPNPWRGIRTSRGQAPGNQGPGFRFYAFPLFFLNFNLHRFLSKKYRKKCENQGFGPPKPLPKPFQNPSKNDVPENMQFFIDFCSNFDACCKSQHQKNVRPRSVLLMFRTIQCFAFGMHFFIDFCSNFDACCKSQHQKNMRPRSVLLGFHTFQCFAFGMHFRSKKPTKNPSKTRSEPIQNRCRKRVVF